MNNETYEQTKLNETIEVLTIIAKAQMSCADVKLSIGSVSDVNQVINGGVYITDCPPIVIEKLENAGFILSLNNGKLSIAFKDNNKINSVRIGGVEE